jgi:ubiquinone biosynthesis protein
MNIWQVARPVVEDYIKQSIGPKAVAGDLAKTARVLARFGPRLPTLVERALIRQAMPQEKPRGPGWGKLLTAAVAGAIIGAAMMFSIEALL